ncbi:XkdX family protein [Fructobacillus sp. CRL 2054]|nr:XkdX family protein [Fructobacillus sp. CRL 2054]MDD9139032.1 XkdX family protein [Fructobacillus sp. CRL 2054]
MFDMLKQWYDDGLMTAEDLKIWVPGTLSESDYKTITEQDWD